MKTLVPDGEFIKLFQDIGPQALSEKLDINVRNIHTRRRTLERQLGITILPPLSTRVHSSEHIPRPNYPHRIELEIKNGHAIIGSDFHYWPGDASVCHRAIIRFIKDLKPKAFVANGDVMDAATISKYSPIGWESRPSLIQEIETAQDRMYEIASACPRGCQKIWTLGNHDARFETKIATVAPEFAKIHGVHLRDHFSAWQAAWSCFINDVVVKHRFKGGIHATHNNAVWSGRTMVTGHLHSAKVTPFTDYNGTRYGVDSGCVAEADARAFVSYTEDAPKNWISAFCVLTFRDGKLLVPELVMRWDSKSVQFRGEIISV